MQPQYLEINSKHTQDKWWEIDKHVKVKVTNNDNLNDLFTIKIGKGNWNFEVYNRWGRHIESFSKFNGTWDPKDLNDGVYYYKLYDETCSKNYNSWIQIMK